MSAQVVSSKFWEVRLPDEWALKDQEIEHTTYVEAPDGSQGVYVSTWRDSRRPLLTAMQEARAVERRNLPHAGNGSWEVLQSTENDGPSCIELLSEYLNLAATYRIVSRMLGRDDCYVRLTYHDYDCKDLAFSIERAEPWVRSLSLRAAESP